MAKRNNGGILGTSNTPVVNQASGIWGLEEQQINWQTFPTLITNFDVEYLVVAGGGTGSGGGSNTGGAGGGAGGYRTASSLALTTSQAYVVTVGAGGTGGYSNGSNSTFHTIVSAGGGRAGATGRYSSGYGPWDGGSGGGRTGSNTGVAGLGNVPATSPPQGNNGGIGSGAYTETVCSGGGGGGAGGPGSNQTRGTGAANSITGSSVVYATGGLGKSGSSGTGAGDNGTENTGNGGDGGNSSGGNGGNGGSGVVILKYPSALTLTNPDAGLVYTTTTPTAGYKVTRFTGGTGNIQFS